MQVTTISSSRRPRGPPPSSGRPSQSSSPRKAASRPASCARSKRRPSPCASPPVCEIVSIPMRSDSERPETDVPRDDVLVLPANLVAETANGAVLAAGLQSQNPQGLGNNHLLLLVVRGRDTLENLEALKGGGTAGGLVGDHAADSLVEDPGGGTEVEGTWKLSEQRRLTRGDRGRSTYRRASGCTASSCGGRHGT